jgi:hypothetical protein
VDLERDPLSLVSTTEELLGRKSCGSGLESREYARRDPSRCPRCTLYLQKLALTSPTSGGRSVFKKMRLQIQIPFIMTQTRDNNMRTDRHNLQITLLLHVFRTTKNGYMVDNLYNRCSLFNIICIVPLSLNF